MPLLYSLMRITRNFIKFPEIFFLIFFFFFRLKFNEDLDFQAAFSAMVAARFSVLGNSSSRFSLDYTLPYFARW